MGRLTGRDSLLARQTAVVRAPAQTPEELCRDDEIGATNAELLEGMPDVRLGLSPGVRLGGVDHVDPILERNLDNFLPSTPSRQRRVCRSIGSISP